MRVGLSLAAAGAVAALAACGGGDGNGGATPSPQEFRQQADAICKRYEQKLDALGTPTSIDDLAEFVDSAVPIIEAGNKELAGLTPPEEFADEWARVLKLQAKNLQTTRELHDAIHASDEAKAQDLMGRLGSTGEESDRLATEMGLQECGRRNA
jgi:hypothetical protein